MAGSISSALVINYALAVFYTFTTPRISFLTLIKALHYHRSRWLSQDLGHLFFGFHRNFFLNYELPLPTTTFDMSSHELHTSLLRPTVLHILRAAGFQAARPAAVDAVVDLAARYLTLLGETTASHSMENHSDLCPTIADVRSALQDVGALQPQISIMEEQYRGVEDVRGVEAFLAWAKGDVNKLIRQVAGLIPAEGEAVALEAGEPREDFLTGSFTYSYSRCVAGLTQFAALKKKHSKTGEESRFKGTVLGIPAEARHVRIEGGQLESIQAWEEGLQMKILATSSPTPEAIHEVAADESSPLTDIG